MTTWRELYKSHGRYVSEAYDISSSFDYYQLISTLKYDEKKGNIDVDARISLDGGFSWGEWHNINKNAFNLFEDEELLENAKLQFQVTMTGDLANESPVFYSLSLDFYGAVRIANLGDRICKPELWIKKTVGSGDIALTNETTGKTLTLSNLNNGEIVYIDCLKEDIVSSLPLKYRYNDHNDVYLELETGVNILTGKGNFELDIRYEFIFLQ